MRKILTTLLAISAIVIACSFILPEKSKKSKISADFKDIVGVTADGKENKLSDYLGKGNYVLVDFWASWCGPCRQETPYIVKVYEQYKKKGLTVVGVAVSDKKEDSIKAIKELGIPYEQILDPGKEVISAYGVRTIPNIILFSPQGEIVQRGMRQDGIAEAVKKVIK